MRHKPRKREKSALARALYPDSAATGYPWAFQRWSPSRERWEWEILGCGQHGKLRSKTSVKYQASSRDYSGKQMHKLPGWFRWAWITRWTGKRRAWKANINETKSTSAVYVKRG